LKNKDNKIKVGVIGAGYLGKFHIEKYLSFDDVDLVGVVDVDVEAGKEVEEKFGISCYKDMSELVGKVDAVSIVVPTVYHHDVTKVFLDSGVDVFVEKPITSTVDEAERLIDSADKKNLILQVGHLERFNPAIIALQGHLKEPMFIESHRLSPFPERSTDVDVTLDLMIHDIDIILNIVKSDISTIDAVGVPIVTSHVDIVNARLSFESGCVANVTASRVSVEKMRKIRIFQSDAYISIDYASQKIEVLKKVTDKEKGLSIIKEDIDISKSDYLSDEIRSFIDSVKTRGKPPVTGSDGKRALEVVMMIKEKIEMSLKRLREMGIIDK